MNEHERLQSVKYIRYVLDSIKENAVDSGDYRAANQYAILSAISAVKPHVEGLMQDASQVVPADREEPLSDLTGLTQEHALSLIAQAIKELDGEYEATPVEVQAWLIQRHVRLPIEQVSGNMMIVCETIDGEWE